MCGNYDMQLQYAKKYLRYALETKNKKWIVSSYGKICVTFQFMNEVDSAIVYANKLAGLLNEADQEELPYFLNTIGFSYLNNDHEKAKYYFEKSLSCKPLARTYENLAWIYHKEGNEEKAYELWKQALLTEDDAPKANVLHNILQYDLERHNIEGACEKMGRIVSIKDSLNNVLKDRTIQKIQQEYDEKKAQEAHQQEILNWIVAALILVIVILLLLGYIRYKRFKAKIRLTEHQMLINSYQNEINLLKGQNEGNEQQIADFNRKINDLIEQESPRLYKGKMLYDQVMHNEPNITWTQDDFICFIDFYKANYFSSYMKMVRKYHPKTIHNTFFLLLYELGKEDKDIRQIMGITQEAIRSTRFRINKNLNT
jgi:tetratricopeptide (TPR) repeat protein